MVLVEELSHEVVANKRTEVSVAHRGVLSLRDIYVVLLVLLLLVQLIPHLLVLLVFLVFLTAFMPLIWLLLLLLFIALVLLTQGVVLAVGRFRNFFFFDWNAFARFSRRLTITTFYPFHFFIIVLSTALLFLIPFEIVGQLLFSFQLFFFFFLLLELVEHFVLVEYARLIVVVPPLEPAILVEALPIEQHKP